MIKINKDNIKIRVKSIGPLELRHLTFIDVLKNCNNLAKSGLNDKELVQKSIFNQLIRPPISFGQFIKIPDDELIRIGKNFVKNERHTFKYFIDTRDFYRDFRDALKSYQMEHDKFIQNLSPISEIVRKQLQTLSSQYVLNLRKTMGLEIAEALKKFLDLHKLYAEQITASFKPAIEAWQKWMEQNLSIFHNFHRIWEDFEKQYKIDEKKAVLLLKKYKWFVSPSLPLPIIKTIVQIASGRGRKDKEINQLFIDYFLGNNCTNLEKMVNGWDNNLLFKKRMKIVINCVETLKLAKNNGINGALVVLPTLIIQIDGLLTDYLEWKEIPFQVMYDDYIQGCKTKIGRKSQFTKNISPALTTEMDELARDIFLNILFQKSQKGKPLEKPFNFNRHKIIHGESLNYGRKDYVIRAFMVLDFLAWLK